MLTDEFGKRLKYWRNKRGLSQKKIAVLADVDDSTIRFLEHGEHLPRLDTIKLLLDALNVSIVDFYSEEINNG